MSQPSNSLSVEAHFRVGKTKSDSGDPDVKGLRTADRNGGSVIPRSASGALAEAVRDVRLVSDGYRRGADPATCLQSAGTNPQVDTVPDGKAEDGQQEAAALSTGEAGKGQGIMRTKARPYENAVEPGQSGGPMQKSLVYSQSAGTSDGHNTEMLLRAKSDNQATHRRGSVGDEGNSGTGVPLRLMNLATAISNDTRATRAPSGQTVAPYHNARNADQLSAMHDAAPRYQPSSSSSQRHRQHQNQISRPTALVRLTRNGPFCPCFSPNDSDTEPSSPVALTPVAQPANWPSRNMASLARELRARFVNGHAARAPASGAPVGLHPRTMHMVAEPYPVHVHTQVEYTHYLVPDLLDITRAAYYWGVMDRFEAERLLDNQPEGTFLLRDSAQSEYLFSVSFRRYNRTLHARIEQLNHRFSFDSYDQGVFSAKTVTELIEHYKDPSKYLFFEPQLSSPLPRNFVFPLQHLCRSVIASCINYNDINQLELPKKFKDYLREYHYKHPVRVTKLE